jgi:uncharacterized protein YqgC (DUF456 family)
METLLIVLAGVAIVAGIAGSVLPFLPGPPLAWLGLLLLHFSKAEDYSTSFLIITAIVTAAITALDYLLPIWSAKRSGGTKYGQRGATVGMILGLVGGPIGIIIGPLIGAFIGELVHDSSDFNKAKKAAWNSFLGFLLSTGLQLAWCLVILFWYVKAIF